MVDDEEANLKLLERVLSADGFLFESAADGPSALSIVAERSPDLILLDVYMPGMDGFEVCRRLKACSATRSTGKS